MDHPVLFTQQYSVFVLDRKIVAWGGYKYAERIERRMIAMTLWRVNPL